MDEYRADSSRLLIGDLVLDSDLGTVSRGSDVLELPILSFRLLLALAQAAPAIVSHDQLVESVWDGRHASPETVMQRIKLVRQALNDDTAAPRYIGVVRGRGYRLLVPVEPLPPADASLPKSLVAELGRRRVLQVALIYAAVAWSITEVVSFLLDALPVFPQWSKALVAIIFVVGFPIAMFLAWRFDIGPGGIKKTEAASASGRLTIATAFLLLSGATAGLFYLIYPRVIEQAAPAAQLVQSIPDRAPPPNSVAVLPFANLSGDPAQAPFVDGLAEELLNVLAANKDLHVTSRTSSFAVDRQSLSVPEIAAVLGVMHVLEGSVRKSGNTIRVTAQLILAREDRHLWSRNYNREWNVDNFFDIQQDVAEAVAAELHREIAGLPIHNLSEPQWAPQPRPQSQQQPQSQRPASLAALDHYLDGMFYLRQVETGVDSDTVVRSAIGNFEQSIEADPVWAPAHAALGRIYHFWSNAGDRERKLRQSLAHLERARQLDDRYGPLYGSLLYVYLNQRDFGAAQQTYERMQTLGYKDPWSNALYLKSLARFDDAVKQYRLAVAVDPLSIAVKFQLAEAYVCASRYDEAIGAFRDLSSLREIDAVYAALAYANFKAGNTSNALKLLDTAVELSGDDAIAALVLALAGQRGRAVAAYDAAVAHGNISPVYLARTAIALGDIDAAIRYLEEAAAARPAELLYIRCHAEIRSLSGNARYENILDLIGFPR